LDLPDFTGKDGAHLRAPEHGDETELLALLDANRPYLERHQWWTRGVRDWLSAHRHVVNAIGCNMEGSWLQYYAAAGPSGQRGPIRGSVTAYDVNFNEGEAKIGWWVAEAAQGQGLATVAARRLIDEIYNTRAVDCVEADIAVDNDASKRLASRLGFVVVGEPYATVEGHQTYMMNRWEKQL